MLTYTVNKTRQDFNQIRKQIRAGIHVEMKFESKDVCQFCHTVSLVYHRYQD